jgi:iron complex outermembrane receptor protein
VRRIRGRAIPPAGVWALAALAAMPAARAEQSVSVGELPTIVVQSTAIAGNAIDIDKIPGNVQSLNSSDLSREGPASLTNAMDSQLGSININANLDDQFQPDILYRGFEASPVLGTPQGLAVYQNGVRINEAFGDTVNWDLFPDIAISQVSLVSSNPVFGLNALGGAISVAMKNGFTYQGSEIELSGGSFGNRALAAQVGAGTERLAFYLAGKALDQSCWRMFSTDSVRQLYAALSARDDRGSLDLTYTAADNHLNGQGAAPVQELSLSRGLVFTGPQANANRLSFLTLNGSLNLTAGWSLQGVLYYRQFQQDVSNGNGTNDTACTNAGNAGFLCQADGLTPLVNSAGAALPDISNGGTTAIGDNFFETIHTFGRGAALQITNHEAIGAHDNEFTAGATADYARVSFYSGTQLGVMNPDLLVLPSNIYVDTPEDSAAGAAFGATPVSLRALSKDYGFYATDTFDVTSAFSVTLSGRYNVAYIDLDDQLGSSLTGNNRYTHFNPAVGGTYKILPTLTVFAGFSGNTRTPTAGEIECSDPLKPCVLPSNLAGDPPTLRQVISHTEEFGARGKLPEISGAGSELSWNVSVFRTQLHDDIYGIATSVSSGFFQNIGDTRRQGLEAGVNLRSDRWSAYANYSHIEATFESALTVPSPSNASQDANGNIQVEPGDRLPGIPRHRLKLGADLKVLPQLTVGATLNLASDQFYVGDASNQTPPLPGYHVLGLHASYQPSTHCQVFATVSNLLNAKYASYGILSDPTGVGAPGIPADAVTNGPGVDNRFQSPAPPFAIFGGVRLTF